MIKHTEILSVQDYLDLVTGKCYIIRGNDDMELINQILKENGLKARNYKFANVEGFIKDKTDVVLVRCYVLDKKIQEYKTDLRWCEFPVQKLKG